MIVTWRIGLRIAAILLATVVLQVSFFSYLSILGGTPDVAPVVIAALGLLGGGVVGAVCGFAGGLLLDAALLQTLGVSSLVLLSVGYLAGRFRETSEEVGRWTPALVTGILALVGAAAFAAIQLMLGVEAPVSLLVLREILVKGLLAFVLALAVFPLVRRALRPALVDEAAPRGPLQAGVAGKRRRGRAGGRLRGVEARGRLA